MPRSSHPPQARQWFFLLCALSAALLLLRPAPAMEAVREALRLCSETIVPSLFPCLVFSALLTALLPTAALDRALSPLMRPIFRLSGDCGAVLALGFAGGYPVGVRTTAALYRQGTLRRSEAQRLLAFCNNSGPGFLLGVVGIGVFGSASAGMRLYMVHIAAALLVGFLFRFYGGSDPLRTHGAKPAAGPDVPPLAQLFTEAVTGSFLAVLNICAFVLFFMIALRLLSLTGLLHLLAAALEAALSPFGMTEHLSTAFFAGLLELSTGAACMQGAPLTPGTAALAAFLLGWGGLSVHCQSLLFVLETDLSCKPYFVGKFLQGLFSAVLAFALFTVFPCG